MELGVQWEGDKGGTSTADGIEEWTGNGRLRWGRGLDPGALDHEDGNWKGTAHVTGGGSHVDVFDWQCTPCGLR